MITSNQYKMDEFTEQQLILQYKQFISDDKTTPSLEIINSDNITVLFLKKCYDAALEQFKTLSSERNFFLFLSYKYAASELSLNLPNELCLEILKDHYSVINKCNQTFEQFHLHKMSGKFTLYFSGVKTKETVENYKAVAKHHDALQEANECIIS